MPQTHRAAAFLDKGGTGKTTTVAHLSVALEELGYSVLLIDLAGKQGDLAKHFGVWEPYQEQVDSDEAWPNISTVFDTAWDAIADKLGDNPVEELVVETGEGPDLIPAHPGLDTLDAELGNIDGARERYSRLNEFLDSYVDSLAYDVVLIDLPGMTNNITYNGLWGAKHAITPVEMGPFEAEQADALTQDIAKLNDSFATNIEVSLVLPNKVDTRTKLSDNYLEAFSDAYPEAIAPTYVPYSQDIRNAAERGTTAFALENPSKTAQDAIDAYLSAAETLIARLEGDENV